MEIRNANNSLARTIQFGGFSLVSDEVIRQNLLSLSKNPISGCALSKFAEKKQPRGYRSLRLPRM